MTCREANAPEPTSNRAGTPCISGAVATGTAVSAACPAFRDDPHPVLDDLRRREPVHEDRSFDRVVLTRARDVRAVLHDRALSADPRTSRPGSFSRLLFGVDDTFRPTMLHLDDPDHGRLRGLASQAFNRRSVEAMRPWITALAGSLLDGVARRGTFDVIEHFAQPLSVGVIARILGVDPSDQAQFAAWSDAQVLMFNPARSPGQALALAEAEAGLHRYLTEAVAVRRVRREDDLISRLVDAEEDGERLTAEEIVDTCRILLVAGNVTTRDLIGNGAVALLRHPTELARLRGEPGRIGAVVEEVLRYDPPVTQATRQTAGEAVVGGCPVAPGRSLVALLLAANHDPDLHADPHRFDPGRLGQRHHAFGGGTHFCLGAALALAEGQIALASLFARFPGLRLAAGHEVLRKDTPSLNGFRSVWVETGAAPALPPPSTADRAAGNALVARLSLGAQAMPLVRAALDSGLLAAAAQPGTAARLAAAIGAEAERVAPVCDALVALDVLERTDGAYQLTTPMRAALAPDAPQFMANTLNQGAACARMLAGVLQPEARWTAPTEADRLAVAVGVWGLASSPVALASFDAADRAMPEVRTLWQAGARHLELGCGAGRDLLRVAVPYPATTVTGVDVDGAVLEEVRRQASALGVADRVETHRCDARHYRGVAAVDTVLWSQMFFPAHTRRDTIAVIRRVLKPGGYLLMPLLPPSSASARDDCGTGAVQQTLAAVLWQSWGLDRLDEGAVRHELEAAGFTFVRTVPHGRTPYMLMRSPIVDGAGT